ncbi:MAG: type II toxin-antitoxin system ParD family antitoxin, partial [Acidimicrobiia bacterium]
FRHNGLTAIARRETGNIGPSSTPVFFVAIIATRRFLYATMGSSDRKGTAMPERINARLSQPLAEFVERMVGEAGLYETPSEYVRDLIRRDMERRDGQFVQDAILAGYRDVAAGRVFASSGDFKADMAVLDRKEADGWN